MSLVNEEQNYFAPFKKHDIILNNKNESFENKVAAIIDVWKGVGELDLSNYESDDVVKIVDWAKLHALYIALTAEWIVYKDTYQLKLLQNIERAHNRLQMFDSTVAARCIKIVDVVKSPWGNELLMKLMNTKDVEIGSEEIEFFCEETVYTVSIRLRKLCDSQCEDLALNLVTAFMNCNKLSKSQNFSLNATNEQIWFLFDIHIALLYKFQEKHKIVVLLKELTFEEGLSLVKRFVKKRVKICRVWKNCHRVAILATQMYISQAVVKYSEELKGILENYIEIYMSMCNTDTLLQDFTESIRRISNLADAAGLYIFCDVIQRKAGTTLKTFVIEMYIRALTTDMNELERRKDSDEKEKAVAITSRLAAAFCNLADFLNEHVKVARECVLTAFSLEPTKERLTCLEELARRSGFQVLDTGQEWKCKLHPPVLPSDDIAWICPECGDWMCKPQLNIPLKINMALNEALQNSVLGISEALCDDLVVCLSNPRYQILNWFLPWDDLHRLCIMYLQDPQTTKNFVTELKFVDIDYSIFKGIKREPIDELAGIERGYEQYLDQDFVSDDDSSSGSEDSMSQDSRPYSLGSDGAGEGSYLPLLPPQPKSDPNTLKSLRMFRPNLKRSRNNNSNDNKPEKKHKTDSIAITATQSPTSTSNIKDKKNITLSNFLNGVASPQQTIPAEDTNNQVSQSKNVKAATLPPLGGQVAKIETKPIQVKLQLQNLFHKMEKICPTFTNLVDQALKPYNQSINTISDTAKQDLMLKLLNRPSHSGSKENKSYKHLNSSSMEEILDCTNQSEIPSKNLTKTNKEVKTQPSLNLQSSQVTHSPNNTPEKILNISHKTMDQSKAKLHHVDQKQINSCPHQLSLDQQRPSCMDVATNTPLLLQQKCHPLNQSTTSNPKQEKLPVLTPINRGDNLQNCSPQISHKMSSGLDKNLDVTSQARNQSPSAMPEKLNRVCTLANKAQVVLEKLRLPISQNSGVDKTLVVPLTRKSTHNLAPSCKKNESEMTKRETCLPPCKTSCSSSSNTVIKEFGQKVEGKTSIAVEGKTSIAVKDFISNEDSDKMCNKVGGNVQKKDVDGTEEPNTFIRVAQELEFKNSLGVIDNGIFSDLTDKSEEMFFQNNNDYSSLGRDRTQFEEKIEEDLPKNIHLTENIRTYTKKSTKRLPVVYEDCVNMPKGKDKLDFCKNVISSSNSNNSKASKSHSNVQKPQTKCRELKVVLYRLPSHTFKTRKMASEGDHLSVKQKCDRGKYPPKNGRRRKSMDKSENKHENAPNRVQNYNLSPLQDINPRVTPKENAKSCCDDINKSTAIEEIKIPQVLLKKIHVDNKSYARSVLANIPGLNDYQMIRPSNVNHIVNVVQVSGGRSTQNVPMQTTQTSTQVSPHIQRIGQPRVADQKPEHSNSLPCTTTLTTTTTTAKTTTTQPSTLINILSQQIIRPVAAQSNALRRQTPLINILSQQIIRPSQPQKTPTNTSNLAGENNQAKPGLASEQTGNSRINNPKNAGPEVKSATPVTSAQGGTILQFICKSSLPKFQQAFGKTVYQNNTEATTTTTTSVIESSTITVDAKKNVTTKTVPVNVQPIQGSVIYSRQMPVGQTISLIPPGSTTRQVFRIATSNSDQISLVKDSVIHSKMSALLAAALQGRQKNSEEHSSGDEKLTLTRPTLVQNTRIVKPVQLQIPTNVVRAPHNSNLSSTTLEQLREFDMVYKQIKERSSSTTPAETSNSPPDHQEGTQQRISVTYVNQLQKYTQLSPVVVVSSYNNLQPAASPALSVTSQGSSSPCVTPAPTPTLPKIATKSSKGKTLKSTTNSSTTKSSPIPKPQQKPQEDEHTTQRIFDILAEYAEQLRNSPDLNNKPAPRRRSNPPTNPSQNSKRKKSSSGTKKSGQSSNTIEIDADDITVGSEDSSGGGVVQLSVTDDEQSQAATANTPESTENSSPSNSRQLILSEGNTTGNTQSRNLIIADSSVGEALKMPNTAVIVPGSYIMPVSMVKGGQQIAVVSGGSKILATVPARSGQNMLLFQSFMNQNRKGSISAVKYSTIQPISGISSQSLAGVSAQPPVILPSNSVATAVALGQPLTLKKLNDDKDSNELLLTISQPKEENKDRSELQQPDSSTSISSDSIDIKLEETDVQSDNSNEKIFQPFQKSVITNSIATSVIATTSTSAVKEEGNVQPNIINMTLASGNKSEPKPNERMQSVLVTACSSNGPMLSHSTPRYRKPPPETGRANNNNVPNKGQFLHNGEKQAKNNEQKTFRGHVTYYTNKTKKTFTESQKLDSELQKQAAMERELRLQKSLSEECEDLGVDEPSTSDLFPEADLLFDSNHSPSFDQSSQEIIKRSSQHPEIKEEVKGGMNLFSDDENSSSLRTDLFEYVEYQMVETQLDYQARQLMNGTTTSNESGSSGCEDNTLLAKCATMSEVTLNSPISPELYTETSLNKYKFKYSNRKKGERAKQNDCGGEIVSSSEDTIGSITCEDEGFKVHLAIKKTDFVKEGVKCELHCNEDLDLHSGRGARRSVRKLCSCCNGSQDGTIIPRKRPHTSRPQTPASPHKKAFLNKKR